MMHQLGHADPGFTLRVYTHMMVRSPEGRDRLKALVRGERATAPPAARPLDGAAYESEILRVLAERGGSAPRKEVMSAVGQALSTRHGAADLAELPGGPPRWEPRVGKARSRLVRRGWLEDGGRGADWRLTRAGWTKVRRHNPSRAMASAPWHARRRPAPEQKRRCADTPAEGPKD